MPLCLALSVIDLMPIAGLGLIIMWLMMRLRKRQQHPTQVLSGQEQLERYRQARGLRGDLEEVMVEVEQLSRRFGAQLDAKAMMLERLIQDADERLARLEALERRLREQGHLSGEPDEVPSRGSQADSSTPASNGWPTPSRFEPEPAPTEEPAADPLAKSVYQMADAGSDPVEIARTLNEHVGKVELILALRQA